MEEMRQLIKMRNGGVSSKAATPIKRRAESRPVSPTKHVEEEQLGTLVTSTELDLRKVLDSHDVIREHLQIFASRWRQVSSLYDSLPGD